jgi:hypothetical protein
MMCNNQLYLIVKLNTFIRVVTLLTFILVMLGSNSGCYTASSEVLRDLPQSLQAHTEILLDIIPCPFPCTFFPLHSALSSNHFTPCGVELQMGLLKTTNIFVVKMY